METNTKKEHWETIFANKTQDEMSWFQSKPIQSIQFFESFDLAKDANIIDIGAGDSYFVDYLLENGYTNIYVLDISAKAIDRAKARLGKDAANVNWIVSDVLDFKPTIQFDFWHDRAAFHFLIHPQEIETYLFNATHCIAPNRFLVVGTFSDAGPLKCSGIEIKQYSKVALEQAFSKQFEKIKCIDDVHLTPFNTAQHFTFCSFKKLMA
jgi:2-polyprenyl-3-methyl-5-hydroxy-6-metoxy-1,4-benzoquinol methylase